MKTFTEYVEEQETNEMLEEGIFNIIGKILGIGTASVASAWIAALILKGGVGAVNSVANTFGKKGVEFKSIFKKNIKNSPAVKEQVYKIEKEEDKYADDLKDIYSDMDKKDYKSAGEKFHALPIDKQNSTEIRKLLIGKITKNEGIVISGNPTPGTSSFQAIRSVMDLASAKAAAAAFEESAKKFGLNQEQ